jgi:hypothetical protein
MRIIPCDDAFQEKRGSGLVEQIAIYGCLDEPKLVGVRSC